MIRNNVIKKALPALSALITFIMFWMLLCLLRVYPFGDVTLLVQDATGQYLDYFAYAKYALTDHHGLFYTFSRSLGGDFYGFITYYLSSPFNILLLFGNRMDIPFIFTLIIGLKLSVISMAYAYSADRIFGARWSNVLFAVAYAWTGYVSAYFWSVIWLDALIAMPVIVSGLYIVITEERPSKAYFFGLLYAIVTNYYIGYMCGIGSAFILATGILIIKIDRQEVVKIIKTYIAESLLSVLSSAFIWLPTVFSLGGGRASFDTRVLDIDYNFRFLDILSKFCSGTVTNAEEAYGLPNVFCTSVVLILVIVFFADNRHELKNKISVFALLAVFAVSFHIKSLNLIWHGFSENVGYPYRYSFIFCLILILIANKEFITIADGDIGYREPIYAAGIYIFFSTMLSQNDYEYITAKDSVFSMIIVLLTTAVLLLCASIKKKQWLFVILIMMLITTECLGNFYRSFLKLNGEGGALTMTRYENYLDMFIPKLEEIENEDYRMEVVPVRGISTPMLLDYKGISHYSSLEKTFVKNFIGRMGYRNNGNWTVYDPDSLKASDSFLGIRYVVLGESGIVEENEALPILFTSNQGVSEFAGSTDDFFVFDENNPDSNTGGRGDLFEAQNIIWRSITGEKEDIYNRIDIVGENIESNKVTWTITVKDDNPVFLYVSASQPVESSGLYINGEYKTDYLGAYSWRPVCLGEFVDDQVEVSVQLSEDRADDLYPYFYRENTQYIDKYVNEMISRNTCVFTMLSDSHIEGTFTTDEQNTYLMTTIPYDRGWHLEIDGATAEPECIFGALIGAETSPGEHSFVLKFVPRGLVAGSLISVTGMACVVAFILKRRYFKDAKRGYKHLKWVELKP